MAQTTSRTDADDRTRMASSNRRAFIGDGLFFNLGTAFVEGNTVLPTYVSTLTSSPLLIGLVTTIRSFGYFLPQIFVAGYIGRLAKKKPFMMGAGHIMRASALCMAASALLASRQKATALAIFYVSLVFMSFSDGFGGLPWMDLVARTIPADRRAGLFGAMQASGGVAAFGAGFLIRYLLGMNDRYPYNYAAVLGLGALGLYASLTAMHFIQEPPGQGPDHAMSMGEYLRGLPGAWRGSALFRKLIYTRLLLGGMYVALPFFAIHAQKDLGFPAAMVGLFVSAQMVGTVACGPLWGYLGDNRGAHWILRIVSVMTFATGVMALAARAAHSAGAVSMSYAAYFLIYFCLGGSFGGIWIGFTNYLMDIAGEESRGTLIGLFNTIAAPLTLLTLAGGWILAKTGYAFLFGLEACVTLLACVAAWRMPDPREFRESVEAQHVRRGSCGSAESAKP